MFFKGTLGVKIMARYLYLTRHGKVDFPGGERRCIGRTDYGLHENGKDQARELAKYFYNHPVECVYTSPLKRAVETAELMADGHYPVKVKNNLMELDMGEWENRPLKSLKKTLVSEPENGEKRRVGYERFAACVKEVLNETTGDVAIVAHAGINNCFLAGLLGSPLETSRALPQPYGGFSRIRIDGENDSWQYIMDLGIMPRKSPTEEECQRIWNHYHTPENVQKHCKVVCREAEKIGHKMIAAGYSVDMDMIRSASLLHDVARQKKCHPTEGAKILIREGYPKVAEIIYRHHDWNKKMILNSRGEILEQGNQFESISIYSPTEQEIEAAIVYLADKMVSGEQVMPIEKRFWESYRSREKKMESIEAKAAFQRRFNQAKVIETRIKEWLENKVLESVS